MCIWDGSPIQPEDEREAEWHDSEDADTSWKDDEQKSDDGDGWKEGWPGEVDAGPEYYLNKGMERADDEDEQRNRRRKRDDDTEPES